MSRLRQAAADYLAVRRALGFKLCGYDRMLEDFLDHLERSGETTLTVQAAVTWTTVPVDGSRSYWSSRFSGRHCALTASAGPPNVESFNGRVRDELLNVEEFKTVTQARVLVRDWRIEYNAYRPHGSLGRLTPVEFRKK